MTQPMTTKIQSSDDAFHRSTLTLPWWKKLVFALVICTAFLALLEGALRILNLPPQAGDLKTDPGIYQPASKPLRFTHTPGWNGYLAGAQVRINAAGWRGKDFSFEKPPDRVRILGIGDSFTFGRAVNDDEVFLAQLEALLNRESSFPFETINAGHEGIKTVTELAYFKQKEMWKLNPDVVVLGFTTYNDAQPKARNTRMFLNKRRNATWILRLSESDWLQDLAASSNLVQVFQSGARWASHEELMEIYHDILISNYADDSKSWKACQQALLGFHEVCAANNIPLVFIIFPIYSKQLDHTFKDYPEGFIEIHRKVKRVFEGKPGVYVLDMLDDLVASGLTVNDIRVPVDGHPNRIWHAMAARKLYETIKELGLKPRPPTQPDNQAVNPRK
jgi:hypothetical protein